MLALPPAEGDDDADLRAILEELGRSIALPPVVVVSDARAHANLLRRGTGLVPEADAPAAFLLVAPLAVLERAADRRIGFRGNLDQVELAAFRVFECCID